MRHHRLARLLLADTFAGRLAGSLAVLTVVLGIALGLPLVNALIPGIEDIGGTVVRVGDGVRFTAPAGATRDVATYNPGSGRAELTVDGVTVTVTARPYDGTAADLAAAVDRDLRHRPGIQFPAGERTACTTTAGVTGVRHVFRSPSTEGYVCAFVVDGIGVDVLVTSSTRRGLDEDTYRRLEESLATLRFDGDADD